MNLPSGFEFYLESLSKLTVSSNTTIIIAVPFPYLYQANKIVTHDTTRSDEVMIAAQNIHTKLKGASTGEVSIDMLKDLDIQYVIIGHSERRQYFYEDNTIIVKKIEQATNKNINVIFCIGETSDERQKNKTFDILTDQLGILKRFENLDRIIIAYEPVWAIGTGVTATSSQAQEVHSFIRRWIMNNFDNNTAETTSIIYGGSVNEENIYDLVKQPDINGGLVGGASLSLQKFTNIINSVVDP